MLRVALRPMRLLAVAFVLVTAPAGAQTADRGDAEGLFRQGRASVEVGDYARACAAFGRSLALDPAPGTLLNLADCEERMGRVASAWGHFLRVVSVLPANDERHEVARERAATLAPRVPWLTVVVAPGTPTDASVFRDNVAMEPGQLGQPVPVDPGSHGVLVLAPGREPRSLVVTALERDRLAVTVAVGPPLPAVAPPAPSSHAAVWLVGAAGVASLGVTTYFGARALAERGLSDRSCAGGRCSDPLALQAYQAAERDARAADVALAIGVVGLAIDGYLLLRSGGVQEHTALRLSRDGLGGAW